MHIQNILNYRIYISLEIMLYSLKMFHETLFSLSHFPKPFSNACLLTSVFVNTKDVFWVFWHLLNCLRYSTFWIHIWCCHRKFSLKPPVPTYVTWEPLGFFFYMSWRHKFTISATHSLCCSLKYPIQEFPLWYSGLRILLKQLQSLQRCRFNPWSSAMG